MSFFPLMYSTLGAYTIISYPQAGDIIVRIIGMTLNSLTSTISMMATNILTNHNTKMKEYMDELELLDIEIKLKLVENWLKEIDMKTIVQESNLDIIYRSITESCHTISFLVHNINKKIINYNNLWLKSWRTIDMDIEIHQLKRATKILTDRLNLITVGFIWENINKHIVTDNNNYITKEYKEDPNYYSAPGEEIIIMK